MRRTNSLPFNNPPATSPTAPTRPPITPLRAEQVAQPPRQSSPSRGVRPGQFSRNSSDSVAAVLGGYSGSPLARPPSKQAVRESTPKTGARSTPSFSGETAPLQFDCRVLQSGGKQSSKPIVLTAGAGSTQGLRPTMEDSHLALINAGTTSDGSPLSLFAVLDGHCGRRVADLGTHLLPDALMSRPTIGVDNATALAEAVVQTDKAIFQQMGRTDGGSTLIAALVHNRMLFVANLGDARAVLYDGTTIAMSVDHKPTDIQEQQRIVRCGSFVHFGRVGACLAVSRALGDFEFKFAGTRYGTEKEFAVSHIPDICQINITDTTQFIILACDGLWDVCSNDEATAFVLSFVNSADTREFQKALNLCASQLAAHAVERGSMDNVTVLIVWFHEYVGSGGSHTNTPTPSSLRPSVALGRPPSQGYGVMPRAASVGASLSRTAPVGTRLPSLSMPKRGNL